MSKQVQVVEEALDQAKASEIRIRFRDDLDNDRGEAMVDRHMGVSELQEEAPTFGLPGGEFGLYLVEDSDQSVRLDPRQTVGEALGERQEVTLRFAPEIRGARL